MNEHSGKAMNCNLSGFYWTYLVLVGFFLNVKSFCGKRYIEKFINSHRTNILFCMLHVCYDKDFVNMQISFLGLIQKVF